MFRVGDTVNYHSCIGGPITSRKHVIKGISHPPNNFGASVAWLTNLAGCVHFAALSNKQNPMVMTMQGRWDKKNPDKKRVKIRERRKRRKLESNDVT